MQLTRKRLPGPGVRGLLATRRGALTLALVCALGATGILVLALNQYRHGASTVVRQGTVLVATRAIPKGTSGDLIASRVYYTVMPVLASQLTAGAISDAALLRGKVAASSIASGQQLTSADFASGSATTGITGLAGGLAPTQRAVAVTLDQSHGMIGVAAAGDHVDVYASFSGNGTPVVALLVANALVLKNGGSSGSAASSAGTVLAVTGNQAPALAYASENGKVWLVLRPTAAQNPRPGLMTLASILGSQSKVIPAGSHR